jgi:ATP-dependent helicase/nuclease subunit A
VSATTLAAEAAVGVVEEDAEAGAELGAGDEADGAPAIPWRRGRAGSAIGRAVHAVLQFASPDTGDGELVARATQQAHVEAVPDEVDTIVALARSALAAPSVRAAHRAARMWRELYVAAPVGVRAIEGYVDLLYERSDDEGGGLVLVDYKTDRVSGEAEVDAKVARYAVQTAAYALALEVSTGLHVAEARLVFTRVGGAVERVVPDLEAAKQQVRALLA